MARRKGNIDLDLEGEREGREVPNRTVRGRECGGGVPDVYVGGQKGRRQTTHKLTWVVGG